MKFRKTRTKPTDRLSILRAIEDAELKATDEQEKKRYRRAREALEDGRTLAIKTYDADIEVK